MRNTLTKTCGPLAGTNVKWSLATFMAVLFTVALACAEAPRIGEGHTAAGNPAEGNLESFLGEPKLDIQQVYESGRFPNILVTVDGTVLALWGGVKGRPSEDGGQTWGPEIIVANGFMGGGAIVNGTNGEILAFAEIHHPPEPPKQQSKPSFSQPPTSAMS